MPTRSIKEVPTMPTMPTYSIKVESCECKPHIQCRFDHVPENRLRRAIKYAPCAFRQVEIISECTGEIIFSQYMDYEWHQPTHSYGEGIEMLTDICYGND